MLVLLRETASPHPLWTASSGFLFFWNARANQANCTINAEMNIPRADKKKFFSPIDTCNFLRHPITMKSKPVIHDSVWSEKENEEIIGLVHALFNPGYEVQFEMIKYRPEFETIFFRSFKQVRRRMNQVGLKFLSPFVFMGRNIYFKKSQSAKREALLMLLQFINSRDDPVLEEDLRVSVCYLSDPVNNAKVRNVLRISQFPVVKNAIDWNVKAAMNLFHDSHALLVQECKRSISDEITVTAEQDDSPMTQGVKIEPRYVEQYLNVNERISCPNSSFSGENTVRPNIAGVIDENKYQWQMPYDVSHISRPFYPAIQRSSSSIGADGVLSGKLIFPQTYFVNFSNKKAEEKGLLSASEASILSVSMDEVEAKAIKMVEVSNAAGVFQELANSVLKSSVALKRTYSDFIAKSEK